MAKTILYIATSLDGFIARPDGALDWLTSIPNPAIGDYGYTELLTSIGATIIGRLTYDQIIGFGIDWPYTGMKTYVVTKNKELEIKSPDTVLLTDNIKAFVVSLKAKSQKDIWLVGGGKLVTAFINQGLIDKMILTIIPKTIGEGIPLFAGKPKERTWRLIESKTFDTGVVNLVYEKID